MFFSLGIFLVFSQQISQTFEGAVRTLRLAVLFFRPHSFLLIPRSQTGAAGAIFGAMLANPVEMTTFMAITVLGGFFVVSFGLQKGLERISKFMMLGLLGLIVVLAVNSCRLPGGGDGLAFYLLPSLSRAMDVGLSSVITAAMNQSFFTLSLGIAAMEIMGSYMTREHTLTGEAVRICCLDTFVAISSGLIIFPACFAFGVQPDAGPSLIFVTLPNVFANMAGGRFWGMLFFLFMTFASFTTVISVFENLIASCCDNLGWDRKKSVVVNCAFVLIASIPCVLGYNVLKELTLIGGRDVLDSEDFIVSNILLPLGSLLFVLYCTTRYGWGWDKFVEEANQGTGLKVAQWMRPYCTYVLPVIVLAIFVIGIV